MLWELYFLSMLVVLTNGLPTSNTVLFNVNNTGTWNDAYQICCIMNGRMVQPDSEFKLQQLLHKRIELDLYPEFWVGIYDLYPGTGTWTWQDGSPVTYPDTAHEDPAMEQNCLRYKVDNLSDKICNSKNVQIICEVKRGECSFGEIPNKSVSSELSPVITLSITLQKCLQICLWFLKNATECSGIVYNDDSQICSLYATDSIPLASYIDSIIIDSATTTVYYKDCFSVEKIAVAIDNPRNEAMAEPKCHPQNNVETLITTSLNTEYVPDIMITVSTCHTTILQTPSPLTETVLLTVCPTSVIPLVEMTNCVTSSAGTSSSMTDLSCTATKTETFYDTAVTVSDGCQTSCFCENKFVSTSVDETPYPTSIQTTILETSFSDHSMVSSTNETQILEFSEIYISIKDVARENILDIHNLSSYKRRFISVPDHRTSAITLGVGGSICIVAFFLSIIICDLRCKTVKKFNSMEYEEAGDTKFTNMSRKE